MKRLIRFTAFCILLISPLKGYSQDEILIGLVPEENIFRQMDRHRPLAAYLSEKLGTKVKLTILSKYGDIIDRFVSRKMDGAFFGDFTAVLAVEKLSVEPVARAVGPDGTSTVQSFIFVRSDSGIKNVSDMKGKRMVFVDRATMSGYLFAVSFLKEKGISDLDKFFKEYYFTGSHDSAVFSVLDNRADVGTAESKVYYRMAEKDPAIKNELRIIAKSPAFPGTILCLRKDMPGEVKSRIREILFAMEGDPRGMEVLKKFGALRFIPSEKDDFMPIIEIAKKAGIDIRTYRYK